MSQAVLTATSASTSTSVPLTNVSAAPRQSQRFSEQEWQQFRDADRGVAKMIVGIMGGIFTIGLTLYTIIAFLAARGSH